MNGVRTGHNFINYNNMGYNFHENFQEEIPQDYCPECLKAIAVAALIQYQQDTEGAPQENVQVKLYVAQKTVEVCGSEIRIYSWKELGFTASDQG